MSFYATVQGDITFPTKEALDKVVQQFTDGGWMKDGNFIDDSGDAVTEGRSDIEGLTLYVPLATYNKLTWHFNDLTEGASVFRLVWSSTDGCFEGGVLQDGHEEVAYDLKEWAKKNMPEEDEDEPDADYQPDEFCEWMNDVECAFHEEMA